MAESLTLLSTGRRKTQTQVTEIACEHCSAAGAVEICVQGLWYCTPTCKVESGVFPDTSAFEVMLASTSSWGHFLKFESAFSWFACSPRRVARVIARAKTHLSSAHGT